MKKNFFGIAAAALLIFASGSIFAEGRQDFTRASAMEMTKLEVQDSFRFIVSTDVTLKRRVREVSSIKNNTKIKQNILNEVMKLTENTTGRVGGEDKNYDELIADGIEIAFEERDKKTGIEKTMKFVLKDSKNGRFYFDYVQDEDYTEEIEKNEKGNVIKRTAVEGKLIKYGIDEEGKDILYEVSYRGKEEPYLMYVFIEKEKTKTKRLKGVK